MIGYIELDNAPGKLMEMQEAFAASVAKSSQFAESCSRLLSSLLRIQDDRLLRKALRKAGNDDSEAMSSAQTSLDTSDCIELDARHRMAASRSASWRLRTAVEAVRMAVESDKGFSFDPLQTRRGQCCEESKPPVDACMESKSVDAGPGCEEVCACRQMKAWYLEYLTSVGISTSAYDGITYEEFIATVKNNVAVSFRQMTWQHRLQNEFRRRAHEVQPTDFAQRSYAAEPQWDGSKKIDRAPGLVSAIDLRSTD